MTKKNQSKKEDTIPRDEAKPVTVAMVEWLHGDRRMSEFMGAAGLGISGVGYKEHTKLIYKPGEVVDEARVLAAVNHMIKQVDEGQLPFVIFSPRVLSIYETFEP